MPYGNRGIFPENNWAHNGLNFSKQCHLTNIAVATVLTLCHVVKSLQLTWRPLDKLDKLTAHRHLKSPRSLCGRSLHLTFVTKWSRSWSWMTYSHPICSMSIGPPILRYSYFKIWQWKSLVNTMHMVKGLGHIWPWKLKDQGQCQCQTWWSHLRRKVQSICLLFVWWQSGHFGLRNSKFHIWPWKSRSRSWPRSNLMVTFAALGSIDMYAFGFMVIGSFLAEI